MPIADWLSFPHCRIQRYNSELQLYSKMNIYHQVLIHIAINTFNIEHISLHFHTFPYISLHVITFHTSLRFSLDSIRFNKTGPGPSVRGDREAFRASGAAERRPPELMLNSLGLSYALHRPRVRGRGAGVEVGVGKWGD